MADHVDVLVVDDDHSVRTSCAEILREANYSVVEAADAWEALRHLASYDIGAILLDIFMPDRDGLWLLDQLEDPPPVVLITARNYDLEVMARREKVFMYLQKPVRPPELLNVVARAMAMRKTDS